jgi:hypothetical protein
LCTEFADVVGFANVRMTAKKTTGSFGPKKIKAVGSGERVLGVASRSDFLVKT